MRILAAVPVLLAPACVDIALTDSTTDDAVSWAMTMRSRHRAPSSRFDAMVVDVEDGDRGAEATTSALTFAWML